MPCYSPLRAYYSRTLNPSGKRSLVFTPNQAIDQNPVDISCGQCIGCRLERSRNWAVRCVHEASLYENNCFITLTYDNENLPKDGSLDKTHFQKFMKRLRKTSNEKIRFFQCGEYGEKNLRPHYHACLFNYDFSDKVLYRVVNGNRLYTSASLQRLWPFGFNTIGDVTFDSAAYVARYITKKILGKDAWKSYCDVNYKTGEITKELEPEYTTMSRRPGIGKPWLEKYKSDVYPLDYVVINGKKVPTPKYYDKLLEVQDPELLEDLKERRLKNALTHSANNTTPRLLTREKIKETLVKNTLKRNYEQ